MINDSIKKLQKKISELENKLERFENSSVNKLNQLGFSVYTKQLLNFKVLNSRKFHIATIDNSLKNNLFIQARINFFNHSLQDIQFNLYCNNIKIGTTTKSFENNLCEISISGTYQDITSNKISVYLSANPKSNKVISIISSQVTVWGVNQAKNEEYEALETSNNYFLSYISNEQLFYKLIDKDSLDTESDFIFLGEYKSHSICKDCNDIIFLFKIDLEGNLFIENFQTKQETFISKNIDKISCCYFNNQICFVYISNGDCYSGEIIDNAVISNKKITSLFGKFSNCYLYTNKQNNKCFLILNKPDGSNYLLENISSTFNSSENICSEIELSIATEEGNS